MSSETITPYSERLAARVPHDLVAEIRAIQEVEEKPLTVILIGLLRHGLDAYKKAKGKD